jgi:hypothetical protein
MAMKINFCSKVGGIAKGIETSRVYKVCKNRRERNQDNAD